MGKSWLFQDMTGKDYLKRIKNNYAEKLCHKWQNLQCPIECNVLVSTITKPSSRNLALKNQNFEEFKKLPRKLRMVMRHHLVAGTEGWTL